MDDQEIIRGMIGALVEDHGCTYVSFSDPLKASSYYEANPTQITVMIVDLTMRSVSGAELVSVVRFALPITS
jgi:CheY-like chemotaxis protein